MAFTNRLDCIVPSLGTPIRNDSQYLSAGNALSTNGVQTTSLGAVTAFSPTLRAAKMRIKIYNGAGTSPTVSAIQVNVRDATHTETVFAFNPAVAIAISSVLSVDVVFQWLSEYNVTRIDVLTTLGGTSPTATMDFEVSPTVGYV